VDSCLDDAAVCIEGGLPIVHDLLALSEVRLDGISGDDKQLHLSSDKLTEQIDQLPPQRTSRADEEDVLLQDILSSYPLEVAVDVIRALKEIIAYLIRDELRLMVMLMIDGLDNFNIIEEDHLR